jgi:hypothetical protein
MPISDVDLSLLKGNAIENPAKAQKAVKAWERMFLDMVGEIESDNPPPGYLPVVTTTELVKAFKAQELPASEMPNFLDFPSELWRLGARPLMAAANNPKRANPLMGARLWRIVRWWTDQNGVRWDIEHASASRLAKLYFDRVMPPGAPRGVMPPMTKDDLKLVVDNDEDGDIV